MLYKVGVSADGLEPKTWTDPEDLELAVRRIQRGYLSLEKTPNLARIRAELQLNIRSILRVKGFQLWAVLVDEAATAVAA